MIMSFVEILLCKLEYVFWYFFLVISFLGFSEKVKEDFRWLSRRVFFHGNDLKM